MRSMAARGVTVPMAALDDDGKFTKQEADVFMCIAVCMTFFLCVAVISIAQCTAAIR